MSMFRPGNVLRRETLIAMLRAALLAGELRFARQAVLGWLAAFPGDLEVTLLQAQVLIAEGRPGQATSSLEALCRKDPFYGEAYRALAQACHESDPARSAFALTGLYVLDGQVPTHARLEPWGAPLRQARLALDAGDHADAQKRVREAQQLDPDLLLSAALHLLVGCAKMDTADLNHLAELYHNRWPDCLLISLVLAKTLLDMGSEPEAVRLLHLCAANDTTGQVAGRLWGQNHPYRSLWPVEPVIIFDQPVPAGVAGRLGWNHLPPGQLPPVEMAAALLPPPQPEAEAQPEPAQPFASEEAPAGVAAPSGAEMEAQPEASPAGEPGEAVSAGETIRASAEDAGCVAPAPAVPPQVPAGGLPESSSVPPAPATAIPRGMRSRRRRGAREAADDPMRVISGEFERLAKKLKLADFSRVDGRQPVYVIFSSREGLVGQYGPQTAAILDSELRKLAALVRQRRGWDALIYYPDDAICTARFDLTPVNPRDPWKLKNALADLDGALAKRGQMIGALLIVGGETIVPFHRLPNPTDDIDGDVISDSPYATLGANYFVPDWPVGRLPAERGPDAGLLLEQLRQMQRYHARRKQAGRFLGLDWSSMFLSLFARVMPQSKEPGFGYTAAVWRRSSLAVFRPIGAPHTVKASPPEHSGSVDRAQLAKSNLGYYNLHGLEDSPAWYGQRDPLERSAPPEKNKPAEKSSPVQSGDLADYPVALAPEDLHRNGRAQRVIFSEACYGGHVFGKTESESLVLKFLSMGALAVIGSTGIAYGSVNTPLLAADLLGNLFWQHLKNGRTVGEALLQARIDLVREMDRRQGFLDGEDQKTLISFVLYGDPLAGCDGFQAQSKSAPRLREHPLVKTVSDHTDSGAEPPQISGEAMRQVKQIVAEYLPGADLASLHLARQSAPMNGEAAPRRKNIPACKTNGRVVVTVSKQVQTAQHLHRHYVRVTLDEGGKPVKLSTSR